MGEFAGTCEPFSLLLRDQGWYGLFLEGVSARHSSLLPLF